MEDFRSKYPPKVLPHYPAQYENQPFGAHYHTSNAAFWEEVRNEFVQGVIGEG